MKIIKEIPDLIILKQNNILAFFAGIIMVLVGFLIISKPSFFTGQAPLWLSLIVIVSGVVVIFLANITTIILDKNGKKLVFKRRTLIDEKIKEYDLASIKQIISQEVHGVSRGGQRYSYYLFFVLDNGERIPFFVSQANIMRKTAAKKAKILGEKIATFLNVPFEEKGTPTVNELLSTVYSSIQNATQRKTEKNQKGFAPIQILLSILVGTVILGGVVGGVLYFAKQPSLQIEQGSCGDGVCQNIEKEKGVCPTDCVIKKDEQADKDKEKEKPDQVSKEGDNKDVVNFQDSPFGIFAAFAANEFGYFNGKMGYTTNEKYWEWAENHMKNLGAHWTRSNMQLLWDMIEPTIGGGYQWDNQMLTDSIVKRTYSPGNAVNWLGVFHEAGVREAPPKQKTGATRPAVRNPLDYPKEYGAFVKAVVERYDGDGVDDASPTVKVKYWQAGNEVFTFGDKSSFDLQKYAEFVRLIRSAAKEADLEAKIVLVAPTEGFSVNSFLKQVIEELAPQKEFDVIDVHHWGTAENWKMTAIPHYRQLLDTNGLKDVEIWSTENGTWQGTPGTQPSQTEQDQATSLIKRYVYNIPHGLDKLFWNNLVEWNNFNGDSGSIYNSMGLISDGQEAGEDASLFNVPRLSYYTYKKMTDVLEGSDWNNIQIIQEKDGVYIYKFIKNNKPIWVVWNDNNESKQITISDITSGQVKITEAISKYKSGKDVADYSTAFNTETKAVSGGKTVITLKDIPVFVE